MGARIALPALLAAKVLLTVEIVPVLRRVAIRQGCLRFGDGVDSAIVDHG